MTNQLNYWDAKAFSRIQKMPNNLAGVSFKQGVSLDQPEALRRRINEILIAWRDNPSGMRKLLGFDLPEILNMKFYTTDEINDALAGYGYQYRVVDELKHTDRTAEWIADAGVLVLPTTMGMVRIDSNLNRYLTLTRGRVPQIFECTNGDLLALPELDKTNIRAYLTGLID